MRNGRRLGVESLEERRMLASVPVGFTESVIASGLTSPTTLDIEPSGRIWLAYQDGRIEAIEPDGSGTTLAYQLDADGSAEHGLQGLELDPDFDNNHYIYVYYTANSPQPHNRLSRLTVDPTTENTILAGSEVSLLDLPNLSDYGNPPWHIGGAVVFDAEGHLYVQIGESQQSAQSPNLESQLGKVFRINADGSIPTDNPYYDAGDGITWRDYIWASGLRNPFAGDLDPITGRYLIADVGEGSWEEINDATQPGQDFGWPSTEGYFNSAQFPDLTQPLYAYSHAMGCAITGIAFTQPGTNPFPAQYQGKVFYSEFCSGQILLIDPSNPPAAGAAEVFATGAQFPMNIEFGPDGSLYYISRGAGAGGAPGIGAGSVRRIAYATDVAPSIVSNPTGQLASVGYDAQMSVSAAGTSPLAYQWQVSNGGPYVDIPNANASTLVLPNVQLTDSGKTYRAVVTNGLGSVVSTAAALTVTSDTPPVGHLLLPSGTPTYRAGDVITFSGVGLDAEDGTLADSELTWRVDFHHNVHSHPFIPPTSGIPGGSFQIPTATETDDNVWYRINLTVTDSAGLSSSSSIDVLPEKSDFVVETNLPDSGGELTIDGRVINGPFFDTGVVNVQRTLSAPQTQTVGGQTAYFYQWIDGVTTNDRTISTPEDDTAYVALYRTFGDDFVYLSDLTPSQAPVNGWGPIEYDTSNGEDQPGDGSPLTLNGVTYGKGLGVHAYSEVTYALNGDYARFQSDIGVDDEVGGGSVVFRVLVDGIEVFNSLMTGGTPTETIDLSVEGANELKLIVGDAGDGDGEDHADWAGARLTQIESEPLVSVNFQMSGEPAPIGYLADGGQLYGDQGGGWSYGWSSDHTDLSRQRDINADPLLDTLVHFHAGGVWEIAVPNGEYLVKVSVGDAGFTSDHTLDVEGLNYWSGQPLEADDFATATHLVVVNDGRLTLDAGAAGDKATRINYLEITSVLTSGQLLPFSASDIDLNGRLDLNDVAAFAAGWGADGGSLSPEQRVRLGDLDFDGDTDADDWTIFSSRWLTEGNTPISLPWALDPIAGDYDRNGTVAQADYDVWKASYGATGLNAADGNGDGVVNAADYTVWRDHLGDTNGQPPEFNTLVLTINPSTGAARLWNNTADPLSLIGYSIVSANGSLLPNDGNWDSLQDQALVGWEEAFPTTEALSELNPAGSTSLLAGASLELGVLFDLADSQSGVSLDYATEEATDALQGVVVFSDYTPPPLAVAEPARAAELAIDEALSQAVEVPSSGVREGPAPASFFALQQVAASERGRYRPLPPGVDVVSDSARHKALLLFGQDGADHEEALGLSRASAFDSICDDDNDDGSDNIEETPPLHSVTSSVTDPTWKGIAPKKRAVSR